jgi:hypothetical protein
VVRASACVVASGGFFLNIMSTKREKIDEWVDEVFPEQEILLADGFEDAFVGVALQFNKPIAVFDYDKCIEILQKDGMSTEDANEYFDYNVGGAYVGENTPAFLFTFKH